MESNGLPAGCNGALWQRGSAPPRASCCAGSDIAGDFRRCHARGLVGESGLREKPHLAGSSSVFRFQTFGRAYIDGTDVTPPSWTGNAGLFAVHVQCVFQDQRRLARSAHDAGRVGAGRGSTSTASATATNARSAYATCWPAFGPPPCRAQSQNDIHMKISGGQRQRINIARSLVLEPATADRRRTRLGAGCQLQAQVLDLSWRICGSRWG